MTYSTALICKIDLHVQISVIFPTEQVDVTDCNSN